MTLLVGVLQKDRYVYIYICISSSRLKHASIVEKLKRSLLNLSVNINPFHANVLFLYPLIREYRNRTLTWKGLIPNYKLSSQWLHSVLLLSVNKKMQFNSFVSGFCRNHIESKSNSCSEIILVISSPCKNCGWICLKEVRQNKNLSMKFL